MAHQDVVQESGSDIDNAMLIGIGLATTFAVVGIVYFVLALDQDMNHAVEDDRQHRGAEYVAYQTDQEAKFGDYRWADKDKKLVAIPREDAQKMVAKGIPEWTSPEPAKSATPSPAPEEDPKDKEGDDEKDGGEGDEEGTDAPDAPAPEAPAPSPQTPVPAAPKAPAPAAPKAPVPAAPKAPAPAAPKAPTPGGI